MMLYGGGRRRGREVPQIIPPPPPSPPPNKNQARLQFSSVGDLYLVGARKHQGRRQETPSGGGAGITAVSLTNGGKKSIKHKQNPNFYVYLENSSLLSSLKAQN